LMVVHGAVAALSRGSLKADLAAAAQQTADETPLRDAIRGWRQTVFYQVGDLGTVNAHMVCGLALEQATGA